MKDKLNQFINNVNGEFIEVSYKEAIYQCMDLAYLWVFCLGFPKSTIQHGSAFEVYTQASDFTRQFFEVIENKIETIPQAGDLCIWSNKYGPAGHIAVVIEATKSKMKVFEQNNPLGTNAHIQDRPYTSVLGFLRPKNVIIDGVPQWLTTLLQEQNLTTQNETEIRAIFDKAKKYNDDVPALQEQVKSANQNLADKSLEVSDLTGKNQTLASKVDELQKLYNDAKTERDDFSFENKKLTAQVELLTTNNESLQKGIGDRDETIKGLKIDVVALEGASVDDLSTGTLFNIILGRFFKRGVK
jgi:hypothetical protein